MPAKLDLIGKRFTRLLVIERLGRVGTNPAVRWLCQCDCGNTSTPVTRALMAGDSRSCGCLTIEASRLNGAKTRTHGMKGTKTHNTWVAMKQRCLYPKNKQFKDYGGRGITVCERWMKFENFLADMGERPPGTTLDRIDTNGNYEPGNCRWATALEQGRNRADVVRVHGKTVQQIADETGVSYHTTYMRIRRGTDPYTGGRKKART